MMKDTIESLNKQIIKNESKEDDANQEEEKI